MKRKNVYLGAFIVLSLLFGSLVTNSRGFPQTPAYVGTGGDSLPECTDILKVWIDNNATFLQFELELNGSVDEYYSPIYLVFISVDNSTGTDWGWDLPFDYEIFLIFDEDGTIYSVFSDENNGSNDHDDPIMGGLMYYMLSNNNHTLEIGYKIQTYDDGLGFLNVSIGQTVYLKFQASLISDIAPNLNLFIRYILIEESGGIPGFHLPFLSLAVLTVIIFYLIVKKKTTI